jgi:hypothetical protein
MIETKVYKALDSVTNYCENENFYGYDPYDTLNSFIPFRKTGKYLSAVAIQIQKRNPINVRPFLGVKKGINPKAMGLFLKAYSILYKKTGNKNYLEKADWIFQWLQNNYSTGYSGHCWGYNFDWASPGSYLEACTPSVVVTSFVIDGVFEYYKTTKDAKAVEIIESASNYITNDIPVLKLDTGISFSYTHLSKGACYNASLLAGEILTKANTIKNNEESLKLIEGAISFVLSMQKTDGSWYYSYDPEKRIERKQIDFHQGFILVSLQNILDLTGIMHDEIETAISRGLRFYREEQFFNNGRSLWRLPKKWPVDIHNQSQGIITFSRLRNYDSNYLDFSNKIAGWTIENMQSPKGYCYYRKTPFYTNKISYMRWSNAWMMLALAELMYANDS